MVPGPSAQHTYGCVGPLGRGDSMSIISTTACAILTPWITSEMATIRQSTEILTVRVGRTSHSKARRTAQRLVSLGTLWLRYSALFSSATRLCKLLVTLLADWFDVVSSISQKSDVSSIPMQ
jgi:hypothetical protein